MREQLESLNAISLNFGSGGMVIVNILLAFVMFGVALGIKLQTFKEVFRKPKSIITGICLQWIGLPLVTFLITIALNKWITPMVALGMILVACCPGGNISNFISSLSKGNVELSVSMTAVTTVFSPVTTPLNFYLWGTLYYTVISASGDIPKLVIPFLPMLMQILLLLGIPIILGILFARRFPETTKRLKKPAQIASIVLFVGMVAVSFAQNFRIFIDNIFYILIIVLFHNAAAFATGYFGARLAGLSVRDRRTTTIEVGIQNSGLGLALLFNPQIFQPEIWQGNYGGMLFITAWWGIWHIISGLTLAGIFRSKPLPVQEADC